MSNKIIEIIQAIPRIQEFQFREAINWTLSSGQHWAVIGPNGSGKTLFSDIITGKIPLKEGNISFPEGFKISERIKSMSFRDIYSLGNYNNMYYQQRWNSSEIDEVPLVKSLLKKGGDADHNYTMELFRFFGIEDLPEKQIILLSSGELRKFLIIKTLLSKPSVLILDNPYIGLDSTSRDHLNKLFIRLSDFEKLQIILLISNPKDIPDFITHVQPIYDRTLEKAMSKEDFLQDENLINKLFPTNFEEIQQIHFPASLQSENTNYEYVLKMENIHITYGKRKILQNFFWTIKKEEKWALLGPNGSGKSTLLSLIYADNPQSYANTFYLFDKKRGSGESIWDIKKRIGYISPEIHLYYLNNVPCLDIVGSGFFDSIGLFRKCNVEQQQIALAWMKIFRIENLHSSSFLKISYGQQRLVLLARAFAKNPDLLILDEPLHGLDKSSKILALKIIERFCSQKNKSLIYVTHYQEEIPSIVNNKFLTLTLPKQSLPCFSAESGFHRL